MSGLPNFLNFLKFHWAISPYHTIFIAAIFCRPLVPDTSYHRHFIFQVTSYQREKLSLHTSHFIPSHFIQSDTSYQSLHTKPFHTEVTSYQSLHTEFTSYRSHFIPSHVIPVTSYQSDFISEHFIRISERSTRSKTPSGQSKLSKSSTSSWMFVLVTTMVAMNFSGG